MMVIDDDGDVEGIDDGDGDDCCAMQCPEG